MKNQVNSRLLASLSFLHSCPQLDHIARQSYLMNPESIFSAFSACGHQLSDACNNSCSRILTNLFSTHVEAKRFVSLWTKTGCRSIRMEPRGSNCGMCGIYVVMPTPHIYKNGEMNQRPVLLRPLPGLLFLSEDLGNLILCLDIFPYLLNISLNLLVKKLHNGCSPEYLEVKTVSGPQ